MKKIVFFLILVSSSVFSQQKDVFSIARNGSVSDLEDLIKTNSEALNTTNEYGFSPLILACYKSNDAIATYLVSKKVNLDYKCQEGTALMAATVKGNAKLVELLLTNGANQNLTNLDGITALMYAAQFKNETIVKMLLKFNADKKSIDVNRKSAFEYAVFTNNEIIINLLKNK